MSDTPTNAADLGSAYSKVGFINDRAGMLSYLEDAKKVQGAHAAVLKSGQTLAASHTQQVQSVQPLTAALAKLTEVLERQGGSQTRQNQTRQQSMQQAIRLAQAEARLARTTGDSAGELEALRRAQQAASSDRARYLQQTDQLIRAEQRLKREQSGSSGPAVLPRTFAGFTRQGAFAAAGALGIATTAEAALSSLVELGKESAQLAIQAETIGTAYEKSTERAGVSADDLLAKLKAASRGTVTETNLQLSANKALALGVGEDAQQIADLLTIARAKGKDFGLDTTKAFEDIVTGLGRASPLILDNLGIVVDQERINKEYAKSVGKTVEQLTEQEKKQALVNDVLRTNKDLLEEAGQAELDRADKIAQAEVRLQEAKARLGKATAPIQTGLLNATAAGVDTISGNNTGLNGSAAQKVVQDLVSQAETFEAFASQYQATILKLATRNDLASQIAAYQLAFEGLSEAEFNAAKQARDVAAADGELINYANAAAQATQNLAQSQQQATLSAEDLKKAQEELGDATIQASEKLLDANLRRTAEIEATEERHQAQIDDLNERRRDAAQKTQDDLRDAEADGARERADLVADGAKRIADVEREYSRRRQQLIDDAQRREAEEAERFRQEESRAETQANLSRLESTASFIRRLNAFTNQRGGGGAQARAEARRAREQAIQEASGIADAQGRAEFIKTREQQILDDLERKRENAQRLKDGRRGGSLNQAEAQRQIEEEAALEQQSQQAQLDAIKQAAADRQHEREEERGRTKAELAQQLDDLDQHHREQLDDIRTSNAERLQEFDAKQRERVAQIRKHGDEQLAAIDEQLKKEAESYEKARTKIEQDYQEMLDQLRDDLNERAEELFFPNQTRQQELEDAYATLGDKVGNAFLEQLRARISGSVVPGDADLGIGGTAATPPSTSGGRGPGLQAPLAGGQRSRSRGSVVGNTRDSVLSDQAIDQIVVGGRQTDGFNSLRGRDLHAGVDLATPLGTPVKSPIDGEIIGVGATAAGGNYVKVRGGNGDVWYFGHLSRANVAIGDRVRRGQIVARSGATGTAVTGPHVHVQLQPGGGRATDPSAALEGLAGSTTPSASQSGTSPVASRGSRSGPGSAATGEPLAFASRGEVATSSTGRPGTSQSGMTFAPSFNVDLRGAQFSGGASMDEVKKAARAGAQEVVAEYEAREQQMLNQLATSGPRISS